MRLLALASALSVAALVSAQNSTVIQVGATASAPGGIFQFIPNSITASNGTVVTFNFSGTPGNHSVTQSSFASPCQPLASGFDSGWIFIPTTGAAVSPTWNLTITNDQKPIWFYCKQLVPSPHCVAGMVGAINAPATGSNTFDNFQKAAESASGTPGQPTVGALIGVGASASAAPGPLASGVVAVDAPKSSATAPASSGSGSSAGASSTGSANPTGSSGTSGNGALSLSTNSVFVVLAAALGIVLA